MHLDRHLLNSSTDLIIGPSDLHATINSHGLYSPTRFVLRLSPEVHRKLSNFPKGIGFVTGVDFDSAQAMSTLLHETIHWWQHIGTITGLSLSLVSPAQAHANYNNLTRLLGDIGPKKSLRKFSEKALEDSDPDSPIRRATIVVNNQCDIEFFRILVSKPKEIKRIVSDPYFESVGHSFRMAYAQIMAIVASTFDQDCNTVPDPRSWDALFERLRDDRVLGYYYGSDVTVYPVGAFEIFEGQARFAQLQYLYFASNGRLTWDHVRALGMLDGVYGTAFEKFLEYSDLDWPASIDSPVVGLFLLVCDVACNPGEGFPLALITPESFITDIDPGTRFCFLCRAIANFCPDVIGAVQNYSRDEYVEVSTKLTKSLLLHPPLAVCEELARWPRENANFKALMDRHNAYECHPMNSVVQFFFGHAIAFAEDKLLRPEWFCWPGAWLAGKNADTEIAQLFMRHGARFIDKADDDSVFPVIPLGASEEKILDTFHKLYGNLAVWETTRQWIVSDGRFSYDYRWLKSGASDGEFKEWVDRQFQRVFGVWPDEFEIL